MKLVIDIPDECYDKQQRGEACVFNAGAFGHCCCYEHYKIRHGQDQSVVDAYFEKHPERKDQISLMYLKAV